MWWESLVWLFLKDFITGEVWRLWQRHKTEVKAQAIADAPITKDELLDTLHEEKL